MAILRIKAGTGKGKIYKIGDENIVLGRDSNCEVQILDQGVSRRHSEIFRIGEIYFIRDLESRNHTFLNEKEISEEMLRIGDQVRIGSTVLAFEDREALTRDSSRILSPEDQAPPLHQPTSTLVLTRSDILPGARREAKETRESRHLNVLLHLAHVVAEEKNLSKLFERVSEVLGRSLSADHTYVLGLKTADPDSETGEPIASDEFEILGRFDRDEDADTSAGVSRGIIRECLEHSRSVLTSDASLDQQFNAMASVVMNQLRSVICAPISVMGKNLGVIYAYSKRAEAFLTEDLELVSAIGIQLGSTIELLRQLHRSDQFFRRSIQAIVAATEMRTPAPRGISDRVAGYALAIAKELGWTTSEARDAWLAGMLHDVGSIPMSDRELEGAYTAETKKNHYAREILRGLPELERVLPAIENQNERWDGSGSPEGKKGEAIPPLARVLGIALELDRQLYGDGGVDTVERSAKDALLAIRDMADQKFDRKTVNGLLIAYRTGRLFEPKQAFFDVAK